jgi:hypothetical protein
MRARLVVGAVPELQRERLCAFFKKVSDKPDGPCHHAQAADNAWRNSQFCGQRRNGAGDVYRQWLAQ